MIIRGDDAFMAVCKIRTQIGENRVGSGTGMFVSSPASDNKSFGGIVTASYVARK